MRQFQAGMVSFVLPHRIHWVPHPAGAQYYIISFGQRFLRPDLDVDPLDLEDVPLEFAGDQIARHGRSEALARVIRYLREHLTERLSLEDAAAAAFVSPNYLAYLVWDGAVQHSSRATREHLDSTEGVIQVALLRTQSPELNPGETLRAGLKRHALAN